MILEIIIIAMIPLTMGQYTPSSDTLAVMALFPTLNKADFLDGPPSISHAPTTLTTNLKPSLEQMMYYNYYAASMYCQYQLNTLSCLYCQKFKNDVNNYTVLINNDTDTTALVTISNTHQEIVVAYRGTENLWNVVLDISTVAVNYPNTPSGIKIHVGFYTATMSLYNQVIINVGYLLTKFPSYKVVIVGHSLGAAMARLTQFFLLALNQFPGTKYECYTYGEPRQGNKAYVDYMNRQTITNARCVASADIVPHVPPVSLFGTTLLGAYYYHVQTEYWINGENDQQFCNQNVYEDRDCSDSLGPVYSVLDHVLYFDADYLTCIAQQPVAIAAIPVILQPIGTVPPLPTKLSNFVGADTNFIVNLSECIKCVTRFEVKKA